MANHIVMLATEDLATLATAKTALNVLLAAEIVAAAPQPVKTEAANATGSIAAGPLSLYVCQATVSFQG